MTMTTISVLALAALMSILGFVALLRTKSYVVDGAEATETDLPILGKIKTNYPALVFVAVGAGLAAYALQASKDLATPDEIWTITGKLVRPNGSTFDIRGGTLAAVPQNPVVNIAADGSYEISIHLKHGESFEDSIGLIDYTNDFGNANIVPKQELAAYDKDPSKSLLISKTDHSRSYKPVKIQSGDGT